MEATISELRQKGNKNACISLIYIVNFYWFLSLLPSYVFLNVVKFFSLLGEGDTFSFYSPFFYKKNFDLDPNIPNNYRPDNLFLETI